MHRFYIPSQNISRDRIIISDTRRINYIKDVLRFNCQDEIFSQFHPKSILILTGPEGDFTEKELDLTKKPGCIPVSLGETVLRAETAAIAAVSFIRLYENS
jgi:16S rRNA U1498 N3-methylase RsmE